MKIFCELKIKDLITKTSFLRGNMKFPVAKTLKNSFFGCIIFLISSLDQIL